MSSLTNQLRAERDLAREVIREQRTRIEALEAALDQITKTARGENGGFDTQQEADCWNIAREVLGAST